MIDERRARTLFQLQRGGATEAEMARAVGVSPGAVHKFLARAQDEAEERVAAVEAPVEAGAAPAVATGSVGGDLAFLEQELHALRVVAAGTKDPVERAKVSTKIGELTSQLARIRLADIKARPPDRDEAVARAGHAAADKFRKLLEEALGGAQVEAPEQGDAA